MFRTFYGHGQPSEPLWGPLWRQLQGLLEAHMGGPIAPRWFEAENLDDDQLRASRLWSELTRALRPLQQQRFGAAVVGQLRKLLEHRMPDAARQDLHHYHEQLKESVGIPPLGEDVRFWQQYGGQLDPWGDAFYLAAFRCALQIIGLPAPSRLSALIAAVQGLGWWWPMHEAAVLTDRPTVIESSAAHTRVVYADGFRPAMSHRTPGSRAWSRSPH